MPLFAFKSNNHFVTSSDGIILQVYELTKPTTQLSSIQKADWKVVATIGASLEEEEVSDGKSYNGLSFLDGQGKIEGEKALTTLAQHLKQLHLLVSPKGYCFQQVSEIGMYSDFGIHYLRLNDLFSWPRHKIDLAMSNVWSRLELKYNLPKHKNPSKPKSNIGGGVSKEKEAKLERLVKEKEEELEKLKEEMEEANEANGKELQKLKKAYEDQHKQVQKKDKELRMLKKMKDEEEAKAQRIEELEKLNEDLEEANKAKEEELQKLAKSKNTGELQRQLKKKDVDKMYIWSSNNVKLVDEENSTAWPPPPTIDMRVGAGVQDFDKNDWWYVKTTHPEGGLTMLVYYDGKRSQISLYNNSVPLPLPFTKGAVEFTTHTYNFSFFDLPPLGMRLGFTYRP
ncbi:hypothetical protein LINPERHAP2_LOCUS37028 [Linum perenne]